VKFLLQSFMGMALAGVFVWIWFRINRKFFVHTDLFERRIKVLEERLSQVEAKVSADRKLIKDLDA